MIQFLIYLPGEEVPKQGPSSPRMPEHEGGRYVQPSRACVPTIFLLFAGNTGVPRKDATARRYARQDESQAGLRSRGPVLRHLLK